MKKAITVTSLILSTALLFGCNEEAQNNGRVAELAGIYDWSDDYGNGIVDEWYIGIDADGNVSDYDYNGDTFDEGDNCYYIDLNWDVITHISGNRFNSREAGDFTLIQGTNTMSFEFDNPNYTTLTVGAKTNLVQSDLVAANCVSATSATRELKRTDSELKLLKVK